MFYNIYLRCYKSKIGVSMKKGIFSLILLIVAFFCLNSCKKETTPSVSVSNFVVSIAENPTMNQSVGTVIATFEHANNHRFYFTSTSDDLRNHISINSSTGEITISNPAYFDFEQRQTSSTAAEIEVSDENSKQATAAFTITINITDVVELAPTVTTTTVSSISQNAASGGGEVTSEGSSTVTERGICWSTSPNPTTSDSKTNEGTGTGAFISLLSGLSSNTLYYVRAYATNSNGTSYGNEVSFTSYAAIGDNFQGGKVAYVLQSGDAGFDPNVQHGIIAAPSDQSNSAPWSLTLTSTGATSQAIGSGQSNTNVIVTDQGAGTYAASICNDLVLGGYSDWYLPSMYELEKLYLSKDVLGNFEVAFYWSSSEQDANSAWAQSFNSNSQSAGSKNGTYYVRAVRSY